LDDRAVFLQLSADRIFYILNSILDNAKVILPQQAISCYLLKMPGLAKWVNRDLSKEFSVQQVAQKHRIPAQLTAHILFLKKISKKKTRLAVISKNFRDY